MLKSFSIVKVITHHHPLPILHLPFQLDDEQVDALHVLGVHLRMGFEGRSQCASHYPHAP